MRKYEFTGEQKEVRGVALNRIRAVREFGGVHAGDIGGWIASEGNLDHDGDAWVFGDAQVSGDAQVFGDAQVCGDAWVSGDARVFGDAQVCGDARVFGDAQVCGDARVFGDAQVCGDAWVFGDAQVYGNARVFGDARVCGDARVYGDALIHGGTWAHSPCFIQGTRWSINISSPNTVRCGCQDHTWEEWHNHYAEISKRHDADDVLGEYIQYFNLLCRLYGHEDCVIEPGEAAPAAPEQEACHGEEV